MKKQHASSCLTQIWVAFGIVAIIVIFGFYYQQNTQWGKAIAQQDQTVKEYRAAGMPWLASDLRAATVPPGKNAAPLIKASMDDSKARAENRDLQALKSVLAKYYASRDIAKLQSLVNKLKIRLKAAREVGECSYCEFNRDYDLGPWLSFPEFNQTRSLAELLVSASLIEAQQGRDREAVLDVERALNLASIEQSEPFLIGPMVRAQCYGFAYRAAETLAEQLADNKTELAKLAAAIEKHRPQFDALQIIRSEAYGGLAASRNVPDMSVLTGADHIAIDKAIDKLFNNQPKSGRLIRSGMPTRRKERASVIRYMQTMTLFANRARKEDDLADLGSWIDIYVKGLGKRDHTYDYTAMCLPVYYPGFAILQDCKAQYETTLALTKAMVYRAERGNFPPNLAASGYKGLDPFTKKPLKVISKNGKYAVYSVGIDKIDQGGLRKELSKHPEMITGHDTVASYPAFRSK